MIKIVININFLRIIELLFLSTYVKFRNKIDTQIIFYGLIKLSKNSTHTDTFKKYFLESKLNNNEKPIFAN